ncbi:MAG: hypothetical protein GY927_18750 [bacterium]|nr:hypothetical protein [bacterium]
MPKVQTKHSKEWNVLMRSLLQAKTNILTALLIALISSATTAYFSHWLDTPQSGNFTITGNTLARFQADSRAVLECGERIYSPVQNQCVTRAVFDEEMKRLYAALGIETAAFKRAPTK